ncbi:MAG: AAA family ATPase, partial [Chloroflexota bacterium]|nr:AAA family ATPase [Chloroflexota bacterium]
MSRIIAISNQKGGVGKTTTTINLGATLAETGKRVLLIDLDPQFNCTSGVGVDPTEGERPTIYDVLLRPKTRITDAVMRTQVEGMDLVPASLDLAAAELQLPQQVAGERVLEAALKEIRGCYDEILIDCPPSLGRLTLNALTAADAVLIPIQAGRWALSGTNHLFETIDLVRERLNPNLRVLGILCTMYDARTALSRDILSGLQDAFGPQMFSTVIR